MGPVTLDRAKIVSISIEEQPQKFNYMDLILHGVTPEGLKIVLRELEGLRNDASLPEKVHRLKAFFEAEFVGKEVRCVTKTGFTKSGEQKVYSYIRWPEIAKETRRRYNHLRGELRWKSPIATPAQ